MAKRKQIKLKPSFRKSRPSMQIEKLDGKITAINQEINKIDKVTGDFGSPKYKNRLLKRKKVLIGERSILRAERIALLSNQKN